MKAGIIAAGEGSRLKAEGISLPKPLIVVDGIPLIERLLNSYVRCGITEVACIINEYSLQVKEFVEKKDFGIDVKFHIETTPSSMHSVLALEPYLRQEKFLLSTVDSIFDEGDLKRFIRYAEDHTEKDGVLAITDFIDDEKPLYVQLNADNNIVRFGKEGAVETPRWVTGGLYILSPKIYSEKRRVLDSGMERLRNFLGYLLEQGYKIDAFPFSRIIDIDHVSDIRTAENLLRAQH
jgi:NDP-sugar pyrophosphorylase family protein